MTGQDSDYNESRSDRRRRRIELPSDVTASVACPEHVILSRMDFFRMGGSEKHLSDVAGILQMKVVDVDEPYIEMMADRMGTRDVWDAIVKKLRDAGYA